MGRHLARLPSATLLSPQYVLMETSAATWDHTQTVGWEMSACQETLCVLPPVTPPPPLSAWLRALTVQLSVILPLLHSVPLLRSAVTWELMTGAGSETSVCRRAPCVPHLATHRLRLSARTEK